MNNSAGLLLSPFCLIASAWCPWPFEVYPVPALNFWGSPTPTEHLKTNSISELTDQARLSQVPKLFPFLYIYRLSIWFIDQHKNYVGISVRQWLKQSCPRVGWTRGSGRVGSRFCRILAGRVGSGQHFGFFSFLLINSWYLNRYEFSNNTFGLIDFLRYI